MNANQPDHLHGETEPPIGSLGWQLARLDQHLTGKPWHQCLHTLRDAVGLKPGSSHEPGKLAESFVINCREYYLSDGGYSRVYYTWRGDHPHLFLTGNSLQRVRNAWREPHSQVYIQAVLQACNEIALAEGYLEASQLEGSQS